jgi:hypothetical protein
VPLALYKNTIGSMEFQITKWNIRKLISLYNKDLLNLAPPYQRNFIWSTTEQKDLIKSINKGFPLPNLFLYERTTGKYEIVDGQQRTRTILNYYNTEVKNNKQTDEAKAFLDYQLSITILTKIDEETTIEKIYAKVNKSGLKANNPELKKADYFTKRFLALNESLAKTDELKQLHLFSEGAENRMNDVDLVSELTTLLLKGVTDKKISVTSIYEEDVTEAQATKLTNEFKACLSIMGTFNKIHPINQTRYKQRNDFYTLFQFVHEHINLPVEELDYFYKLLLILGEYISPANDMCPPLREYARNCVMQSNSKDARNARARIMKSILLGEKSGNKSEKSQAQKDIIKHFKLKPNAVIAKKAYHTLDIAGLKKIDNMHL